ncbi:CvfB family protein [Clostridium hydrogenum]|uniref:CvfB family protein n=1 Tax=Clostridium hydrogenum TaxID=2855764 RepID=UPI001F25E38C|nr:S1-like domain-containing RNA-binding protein [Clostridium hydrogenum]
MIKIGEYNELKIVRKCDFGFYLDAETGKTSDDVLIPLKEFDEKEVSIGDVLNVFVYRDSKDRPIATLRKPYAKVSDLAYLKVISNTKIGAFVDFGLERDLFVPMKEQQYLLEPGKSYLFYVYVDKTGRLAATTDIEEYLEPADESFINMEVSGTAYGFQTNGSVKVAVNNKYIGVILKNEYFNRISPGEELNDLRVKKVFEDGKLSLTPRKSPKNERLALEDTIYEYLKSHNGFMEFNDKSSPEDIKRVFHESKNYFKNALGGLMKKGLIIQDETGTRLKQ